MIFGTGPYYFYNSTLNSGVSDGGYPLTTLAGGPYYFYSGSLTTGSNSTTKVGPGNIDMYGGNISLVGEYQSFSWGGTPSTGTMQISLNGGTFTHSEGTLVAQGVTIAQASNDMYIFGSAIDIEAPTATSPSYGAQNIAIINLAGNINLGQNGGTAETIGGVLYAPNSTINIYQSQNMRAPSSGCLEAVGGTVNVFNSAGINAAPCSGLTISATGGMPVLQ